MYTSVILAAKRTPIGSFQGALSSLRAPQLGSCALIAAIEAAGVMAGELDEVIMGCVLVGGMGQAPARQAALGAGVPNTVPATTVNRVCSSGLKAVMCADQMIRSGDARLVAAGGMESMSNALYCIPGARQGLRMGDGKLIDTMVFDGLWDFPTDKHMGVCAELCAAKYRFSREKQDEFARRSYQRALDALKEGAFREETVPVTVRDRKGATSIVREDEEPGRVTFEKMTTLKPAFAPDGTITAANASSISDGAAALVIASESFAAERGFKPLARIIAHGAYAHDPAWFTTAPIGVIAAVLKKAKLTAKDIDLWEINEAFSCVTMAAVKELGLDTARVNVGGGAVALGHPIGCSGARILVTLIHAMKKRGVRRGMAAICNGGGGATGMIIEMM